MAASGSRPAREKGGASGLLPAGIAEEITAAFYEYATRPPGGQPMMSVAQLGSLLRALGQAPTDAEVGDLLQLGDVDGDSTLDINETLQLLALKWKAESAAGTHDERLILEAFNAFDADAKGHITGADIADVLGKIGPDIDTEALAEKMLLYASGGGGADSSAAASDMVVTREQFAKAVAAESATSR